MVLFFSICAFLTGSVFVFSQVRFSKPLLKSPRDLQALLNARSGAWIGLGIINSEGQEDSSRTAQSGFGDDLFEPNDSGSAAEALTLEPGGDSLTLEPFHRSGFGQCLISLDSGGGAFRLLHSYGSFNRIKKELLVTLGSKPFQSPDTVLFLASTGMPEGGGQISGEVYFFPFTIDSTPKGVKSRSRFSAMEKEADKFISDYTEPLVRLLDSIMLRGPLTIKSTSDISRIPRLVKGPLLIDGTNHDVEWRQKRRVTVLGDLQVTGDVTIQDVEFIVGGEIRILDKAELTNVNLFSQSRIFFADDCIYSGQAIALGDVEIYNNALIEKPSTIISTGTSKGSAKKTKQNGGGQPLEQGAAPQKQKFFSMFVRDLAKVDGVLINLSREFGIKTETSAQLSGIMWAEGRVCHSARMHGVIKAQALVSEDDPAAMSKNYFEGSIAELDEIDSYFLPYFIGQLSILAWKEE
jgi:hypothetical protein